MWCSLTWQASTGKECFFLNAATPQKLIKIDVLSQNVISNYKDDQGKTLFSNKIIKIARYVWGNNTYQLLVNIDL